MAKSAQPRKNRLSRTANRVRMPLPQFKSMTLGIALDATKQVFKPMSGQGRLIKDAPSGHTRVKSSRLKVRIRSTCAF